MADPNRALFESVARVLAPLLDELVFVGGSTTGIFLTDPAAARALRDVLNARGRGAPADPLNESGDWLGVRDDFRNCC